MGSHNKPEYSNDSQEKEVLNATKLFCNRLIENAHKNNVNL